MEKQIAWSTGSGNITLTYQGQGDGTITVQSDANDIGSARSQTIIIETTAGSPVITKDLTVSQEACPFPVGDVRNFAYTGNVQSVVLPAGQYKLQCWGAQGGSCSSGYSGGKGGYSEGILNLTSSTTVYIFVGGQGSSSGNGGWNGGGGGSGSSSYSSGDEYGSSTFGCGGGATDIALVTSSMSYSSYRNNRSNASLLSRMIVAGGGSGGAYGYQEVTTTTTGWTLITTLTLSYNYTDAENRHQFGNATTNSRGYNIVNFEENKTYKISCSGKKIIVVHRTSSGGYIRSEPLDIDSDTSFTVTKLNSEDTVRRVIVWDSTSTSGSVTAEVYRYDTQTSTTTDSDSKSGYVGGGTNGGGYSSSYYGKQNGAGSNGSFGFGANQTITNYRYGAGCGGGGWYGGGNSYSDSGLSTIRYSGGGSGFVNTAASAGNRPSGYTGLQLDSGETKAGNTSFPNTAGTGNETGHSGNGYAKITRIS